MVEILRASMVLPDPGGPSIRMLYLQDLSIYAIYYHIAHKEEHAMPRAFSYTRFSSVVQKKGDSYRRQIEAVQQYADKHNLMLDNTLSINDLGHSAFRGSHAATGGLSRFLEAIETGYVKPGDVLLIENLDRLSRQAIGDAFELLRSICNRGITVVTLQDGKQYDREKLNTDFPSLLIALTFLSLGHEESLKKSKRVGAAWAYKRKSITDKPLTKALPAWLQIENSKIVPIPERAERVRWIYEQYAAGASPRMIAEQLDGDNEDTWGVGKRKSERWHTSYIQKILDSDYVVGNFVMHQYEQGDDGKRVRVPVGKVEDYYPAVVPLELYNRVREIRDRNKTKGRKSGSSLENCFSMVLHCVNCGSYMLRVNKGKALEYLVCSAAKSGLKGARSRHKLCGDGYVSTQYYKVEDAFISAVRSGMFAADGGVAYSSVEAEIETATKQKQAITQQLSNLTIAIMDGTLTGDTPIMSDVPRADGSISHWTVREERQARELELKSLETKLEKLKLRLETLKPSSVDGKINELKTAVQNCNIDRQRVNVILRAICSSATMDTKKKEITFQLTHSVSPVVLKWQ